MSHFYIVGGQQRGPRALHQQGQDWYDYQKGLIVHLDTATYAAETPIEYVSPLDARGANDPVLFKYASVSDNLLCACTTTEILIYALAHFERVGYISLPCFNDVHHVRLTPHGTLLVANSGLDMVLELTPSGDVIREWNVLGEPPWARFSRAVDYRQGVSTKPHRAHPNHLFFLDDEYWVTRFEQRDAISLMDPARRIAIGLERVHDGHVHDGAIYFTTVDGKIVIADGRSLCVERVIDLNSFAEENTLLGWCRGLCMENDLLWVGFSRIRPTKFRAAVSWVRQGFQRALPTHLACYDLARGECVQEINLEPFGLDAVFSILPAAPQWIESPRRLHPAREMAGV